MSPSELVLVDGTTGFLGTAVTLAFIKKGYNVRGTARSQEKIADWQKKHPEANDKLEWVIVEDVGAPGAFDEAIKDVTIFAHTASPFHFNVKDNEKDMLIPAIEGTKNAIEAAAKEKSVKRVVITSSFASVLDMAKMPGKGVKYDADTWNPATYDEAKKSDNPGFVYCASKKLAEEAAWKLVKEKKPSFKLSTICPPMILGPPEQVVKDLDSLNTSAGAIRALVDAKELPDTAFPAYTDVRDIADIHVKSATEAVAENQRYLTIAGHFDNSMAAAILRKNFPDQAHRLPDVKVVEKNNNGDDHFQTDSSKVEKELGIKWIPFEKCIIDTATRLFEIEKELKK